MLGGNPAASQVGHQNGTSVIEIAYGPVQIGLLSHDGRE